MQSNTVANSFAPSSASTAAKFTGDTERTAVDFQNFLQLLTAQLRNQDPLSPLDSTEFVAQLASFSTVEQLVSANQRLDSIASSIVNDAIDKYAGLIGRNAEVRSAETFFSGEPVAFRISGNPDADAVEIIVTDENGVEQSRFSGINSDKVQYWNGADTPSGRYKLHAEYTADDQAVSVEDASTFGVVTEVRLTGEGAELRLENGRSIASSQLIGLAERTNQ